MKWNNDPSLPPSRFAKKRVHGCRHEHVRGIGGLKLECENCGKEFADLAQWNSEWKRIRNAARNANQGRATEIVDDEHDD
ncbi:hypothetical protein [Nitrospira sp. BLG_1]|uniref:hypothetical protein n=1 Tax=Nitrospira sp. BLG_1 TaxID=3395883 RepID=UPI0039BD71DE